MKKYLLIILLNITLLTYGQTQFDIVLDWDGIQTAQTSRGTNINYLTFEGSNINYQFGSLPVFIKGLKTQSSVYSYDIELLNSIFDTLSADESSLISDIDLAGDDIIFDYSNSRLNLLPLKYDAKSHTLLLLRSFSIRATLVPIDELKKTKKVEAVYAENSVLSEGKWAKMGIVETGIHKIDRNSIIEMGINPDDIDVNKIGIFGNYGGMLPESNGKERADDLQENTADYIGLDDGSFDDGDYILFYAQSQETWRYNRFTARFDHFKNLYADTVYYFFTPDRGTKKQMYIEPGLNVEPTIIVNSFVDYFAHEEDMENMMYSGKEWFGERLSMDKPEITVNRDIPHLKIDKPLFIVFDIIARSYVTSSYKVFVNSAIAIDSTKISKVNPAAEGIFARRSVRSETFFTDNGNLNIRAVYNTTSTSASAWVNSFLLNYERDLVFDGGQMNFRQPQATGLGNKTRFEFDDNAQSTQIWDITNAFQAHKIGFNKNAEQIDFTLATDSLREFISFDNTSYYSPVSYQSVENQNLHSLSNLDFVIISPPYLYKSAERLALLHQEHDGMQTLIVSPEKIYNEFSSGSQDVTAIRDFMRMLYKKGVFKNGPGYLLMFGDGSFDYKDRVQENTNIVPTYESQESLRETQSYVTDDYFGLLDDDEGAYCSGVLDIGIGRFPIINEEEANSVIGKIENYIFKDQYNLHDWAETICFIADDGDNNLHFKQADKQLASIVDTLHLGLEINKIYSDAHPKIQVPGGYRFPEVNTKIISQVENGALILNYTGHGGLIGWSEELILDVPMINNFDNFNNLPLFITATCEFSRFDDPMFTSAGEHTFLNEKGGAIALLTTTRLAYAHANIILNMRIYNNLLKREDGKRPRLGDMIRMSKNPSSTNFLNFTLLGDPALMLNFPDLEIETTSLNNKTISAEPDTISALSEVHVKGRVKATNGQTASDYNGYIYPKVYDKSSIYSTLGNTGGSFPAEFKLDDKIIYQGKTSVKNGLFEFSFFVPKDISYNFGFGKISYYAMDTLNNIDAWGGFNNFVIGGMNTAAENDGLGPEISLYINDHKFTDGDQVENSINLMADIYDENGISVSGSSLGRDIVCVIDQNTSGSMILNQYYHPELDTYKQGSLSYDFGDLEPGMHTLSLKAWDLMNNSSIKTIEFLVIDDNIALSGVYNYPNPFNGNTTFAFKMGGKDLPSKVEINIYDMRGLFVTQLQSDFGEYGAYVTELKWDGTDGNGNILKQGLYLYKIKITDTQGNINTIQQKMIKYGE